MGEVSPHRGLLIVSFPLRSGGHRFISLPERIEKIMALMTTLVTELAEEDPTEIH
jgi:hypothetical protein